MWIRSMCVVSCVISGAACPSTQRPPATMIAVAVPAVAPATMIAVAPAVRDELAAWTLTASDGSGLALVRVDAKAVATGPLAFTELHLYFRNPEDRVREGTLQLTLPARAAVSRFAMESGGQWLEAEVVPKVLARRAYDDFLHRRQDPALLEKAAGNQFTAKVFPIAPRSDKHLVISYSQELPGAAYALPLRGLPRAERVDVELQSTGGDGVRRLQRLAERDWQPDRDFVAESPVVAAAVGAGPLIAAQIEVTTAAAASQDPPRGVALLVDTSASRALGFDAYVTAIARLAGELGATWGSALPLSVIAFDQDVELIFDGRATDFAAAHANKLALRGAAGASDLGRALAWLGAHRAAAKPRVLVICDGVITAGAEGAELAAAVGQLSAAGVERLDVALAGGLRDEATAARLVRSGLARAGAVFDLDSAGGGDRLAAVLGDAVATDVPVTVAGAAWVYPRMIASARPGTRAMVYARLAEPISTIDIIAGGPPIRLRVQPVAAPLVERAIAGAEIAELESRLATAAAGDATALRTAIAQKSVAARVLSSETSLLVLESDADYARYRIDRKALADVLVVGPAGVEVQHRAGASPLPPRPPRAPGSTPPTPNDDPALRPGERPPAPAAAGDDAGDRIAAANADEDGSPDSDHDGILDVEDRCPDSDGRGDDGCPVRGRVIVTDSAMEILDNVYFQPDSADLETESRRVLDAVAATLLGNPDIADLEIQGHSDERGDAGPNLELSRRRARSVRHYLVGQGVAERRLSWQGYGAVLPVDRRHTPEAWARNRRVAFLILRRGDDAPPAAASAAPSTTGAPPAPPSGTAPQPPPLPAKPPAPPAPVTGELAEIQDAIRARDLDVALAQAHAWHAREPDNVLALIGLGEALEARHDGPAAARIYGSIIDLFPGRADMRRFAGERLARLPAGDLTIDTFRRAVADRPDHMTGHRLLAYALVRAGRPADGFAAILAGLDQRYRDNRHAGGQRVLGDDAGMIGAVYAAAAPARRAEITEALAQRHLALATRPSTRFLLYWETDANDVDLHIRDARGEHAYFDHRHLASGGELYADVTTGYGPECFSIPGKPTAGPYALSVDYYAQGPMGYGMGLVEIQTFDPQRGLGFDDRPFVVMTNRATLELGTYR